MKTWEFYIFKKKKGTLIEIHQHTASKENGEGSWVMAWTNIYILIHLTLSWLLEFFFIKEVIYGPKLDQLDIVQSNNVPARDKGSLMWGSTFRIRL